MYNNNERKRSFGKIKEIKETKETKIKNLEEIKHDQLQPKQGSIMVNALGSRSKGPVVQIFASEFLLLNRNSIAYIKIQMHCF